MKLFKFGCKHNWVWKRNIYGDEINNLNGKRSVWVCELCGKIKYRDELYQKPLVKELMEKYDYYYRHKYENWLNNHTSTCEHIIEGLREVASKGQCWYDVILYCNDETDDKYYYEKFITSLGVEVEFKSNSKVDTVIQPYEVHIKWRNY